MAVSKLWSVTSRLGQVIDYAANPEKTAADIYTEEQYQALRDVLSYAKDEEKTEREFFVEGFLMSVSTIGAFVIGEYPEAVAVMLFYQVGEFFQSLAVERSRKSISDLMDIRPDCATVRRNGELITISPESVAIGEIIIVKPGEKIPLDGVVLDGDSMLDTRALTGESVPRSVHKGDEALSGCMNQTGVLTIKTTKAFE